MESIAQLEHIVRMQHVLFGMSLVLVALQATQLFISVRSVRAAEKLREAIDAWGKSQSEINELTEQRITNLESEVYTR